MSVVDRVTCPVILGNTVPIIPPGIVGVVELERRRDAVVLYERHENAIKQPFNHLLELLASYSNLLTAS